MPAQRGHNVKTRERSAAGGGGGRQSVPAPTLGAPVGGERLPVAPRERKPALAALAVLLILVGALGATVMVMRAGDKISVVVVTQDVPAGEKVTDSAIKEVMMSDISDKDLTLIRWSQRTDLTNNWQARTNILAGSVLTEQMLIANGSGVPAGKSIVGLSLKDGQFPAGLRTGVTVAAYRVGNDAATSQSDSGSGGSAGTNTLISGQLTVKSVSTSDGLSSGDTIVNVIVDSGEAGPLAVAASANEVALVLVPTSSG
ncbi:MAG: hypothetical protein QOF98_1859 [Streptomyces sp.]|jgi:hypothetical protein|nr:hypothetical protein [Streptomyces sp.]